MAGAVRRIYGEGVKFGYGPAIEDGFYYDMEFPEGVKFSDEDLPKIEEECRKIIASDFRFERADRPHAEVVQRMQELGQPYKVETWDSIPDSAKDAEGFWYGDYYGVLSFIVNTDIVKEVPKDWADLTKADYANAVALAGDPRTSNQAVQAAYAAGLAKGEKDAAKAGEAGLAHFAEINKAGYSWSWVGENIYGYIGVDSVVAGWMASAPHRANMLSTNFEDVGVGCGFDRRGVPFWSLILGAGN